MTEVKNVQTKHFWCFTCSRYWLTADFSSADELNSDFERQQIPTAENDPLDYYSKCPHCKELTKAVPHYYANLPKMRTTGPRTDGGKARSALNGVKHGLYTQPHHLLAPANGKYDICEDCEVKTECGAGDLRYCPFKQDLMLRFIAAYENGELEHLKTISGLAQGRLYLVLESCFAEIMQKGVLLKSLKVSNGDVVYEKKTVGSGDDQKTIDDTEKPIFEYKSNPLIDVLPKVMDSLGVSSNQQNMNPGKREDDDTDKLKKGQLPEGEATNFIKSMTELVRAAQGGFSEAELRRKADRVSQALNSEDPEETGEVESQAPDENPFGK